MEHKSVNKVLKIFLLVLFSALTVFNVVFAIFSWVDSDSALVKNFPIGMVEIDGGSMEPDIKAGSLSIIRKVPFDKIEKGDTITFSTVNGLVTHKVMMINDVYATTKGTANKYSETVKKEDYIGKVWFTIPNGAVILSVLSSPYLLIALLVLIVVVFWTVPFIQRVTANGNGKQVAFKNRTLRVLATVLVFSIILPTPLISSAKYKDVVDGRNYVVAQEQYFSSNFLSEKGYTSLVRGWYGVQYNIDLTINNYENDLLFNTLGNDIEYGIYYEIDNSEGYNTDYTVTITPTATVSDEEKINNTASDCWDEKYQVYKLTGENSTRSQHFNVEVKADREDGLCKLDQDGVPVLDENNNPITKGVKIAFDICAETSPAEGFYQKLSCSFQFELAAVKEFLGEQTLTSQKGNSLVTYSIKTNSIAGSGTQNVLLTWNGDQLYLDEFTRINGLYPGEYNDAYSDGQTDYYVKYDETTHKGYLIIPMERQSHIVINFFKKNSSYECIRTDIGAEMYVAPTPTPPSA